MLVQVLPPSVDLIDLVGVGVREATAAFVHAGDVHVAVARVTGDLHVADEGVPVVTVAGGSKSNRCQSRSGRRAPPPTLKSFQETYIRPKNGLLGLLSAQPDSRSSLLPV